MSLRVPAILTVLFAFGLIEARATAPQIVDPRDDLFEANSNPAAITSNPSAPAPDAKPVSAPEPAAIAKPVPPAEPAAAAKAEMPANPLWTIPLGLLTETRSRPPFSPGRRPPQAIVAAKPAVIAAPPPPPKPVEPVKPQLSLVGTIVGSGRKVGIFVNSADKTTLHMKAGDQHDGWILRTVETRQVELANGLESAVLKLPPIDMKSAAGAPGVAIPVAVAVPQGIPTPPLTPVAAPNTTVRPGDANAPGAFTAIPAGFGSAFRDPIQSSGNRTGNNK